MFVLLVPLTILFGLIKIFIAVEKTPIAELNLTYKVHKSKTLSSTNIFRIMWYRVVEMLNNFGDSLYNYKSETLR